MKVYELAKEIGIPSSEVLTFLQENEIDAKTHMTALEDDAVEMVKANFEPVVKEEPKKVKTDADYRPDEMIPCRSVFPGILIFNGDHTKMSYTFNGVGDRRNIEYQDLKAAMLQQKKMLYNPDLIIEDANLINDEHWMDIREVYENMYDEKDIKRVLNLPTRDFEAEFVKLPITAKQTIITTIATQMENGTFEMWNKARIIDKICGTRFDLKQ